MGPAEEKPRSREAPRKTLSCDLFAVPPSLLGLKFKQTVLLSCAVAPQSQGWLSGTLWHVQAAYTLLPWPVAVRGGQGDCVKVHSYPIPGRSSLPFMMC